MSDEELILMYRKYRKKRIIIFVFIFLIILSLLIVFKFSIVNNNEEVKDSVEIKEEVLDNVPPELILTVSSIDVLQDEKIDYLLYIESAIDNKDGDLKDKVEFTEVDTSVLGEQKIVYSVSDSSNNVIQKELVVNVNQPKVDIPLDNQLSNDKKIPENNQSKPNNSNNSSNESTTNPSNKNESKPIPEEKIVKYFLFSDGYTMMNVTDACAAELKKYNRTGMCSPIQDENGIYLGMKLEIQ